MSELIDRLEAIDALDCLVTEVDENGDELFRKDEAYHVIEVLPTVQPEPHWIPVESGFPEDYTDVLVWFEYFRYGDYNCLYRTHGIGAYVAEYNSWMINHESGWKDLRVIAWIPLPKPYKGEGEQE